MQDFGDQLNSEFRKLYLLYKGPLLRSIIRQVKDIAIADDILQETFLRVWSNWEKAKANVSYVGFAYCISRNLVIDHFRKLKSESLAKTRWIIDQPKHYGHADECQQFKELNHIHRRVIAKLPKKCNTIFMLNWLEDKTHKEIGDMLSISPATVNNQLVIANRKIRASIRLYQK